MNMIPDTFGVSHTPHQSTIEHTATVKPPKLTMRNGDIVLCPDCGKDRAITKVTRKPSDARVLLLACGHVRPPALPSRPGSISVEHNDYRNPVIPPGVALTPVCPSVCLIPDGIRHRTPVSCSSGTQKWGNERTGNDLKRGNRREGAPLSSSLLVPLYSFPRV